jgi:hypothetical protein
MEKDARPTRRLDFTKIDVAAFKGILEEHTAAMEQCLCDLTIAMGAVIGHAELEAALRARINDSDLERSSTAAQLLDAAWRASSRHAARDSEFRG